MTQELIQRESAQIQASPSRLLEIAVTGNADVEKLEKLMALQERWDAQNSRKSFIAAMAAFQSECPDIIKNKRGHNYMYAPLSDIVAQIRTLLAKHGLSYRFEQEHNQMIVVTCIVSHVDGHSEKTTMQSPADTSGSKNGIQAIGSAVQYLMRYTLIGALGITTADADMDGRLPQKESEKISFESEAWLTDYRNSLDESKHVAFDDWIKGSISQLTEEQAQRAIKALKAKAGAK